MGQENTEGISVAFDCFKEVKVLNSAICMSVSTKCIGMRAFSIMHKHLYKTFNCAEPKIQKAVILLDVSPSPGCIRQRRK